jgi:DNA adenine methylase
VLEHMRSFVRWAGSKRLLLTQLRRYWPGGASRYVEPFCGSACLFFDIQPSCAILGDLNEELIWTYRVVRNNPGLFLESFRRIRFCRKNYYKLRSTHPSQMAEADRAARFLFLNRACFNGIYRTNLKGEFNVPYGPPKSGRILDEKWVTSASTALSRALLVRGDFETTLDHVQSGDFVYLDPPYCLKDRRMFSEYLPGSFSTSDLERLASRLRRLDERNAKFVITYADSPEARNLLRNWRPRRVRVRRHVAGFSHHRRYAYELIASNCSPRS